MFKYVAITLVLMSFAFAADSPKLSEVSELRVRSAYQAALLAQLAEAKADAEFRAAITAYADACKAAIADNKLPDGTTVHVDNDAKTVVVTVPPTEPMVGNTLKK